MSLILPFVAGLLGPYAKFAKPLIYAVLALLAVGLFFGGKAIYDHKIIAAHDQKEAVSTANADRQADASASVQRRTDDARITQEATQLKEAQSHAQSDHDRSVARFRCIGLQQSARAAGRVVPSCD